MTTAITGLLADPDVTFLFNSAAATLRVVFIAVAGYVTLLALLRLSGQRTLSQLTSLDLVITVTLGSAFGRVITARDVALVEVVVAFASLVALQLLVAQIAGRLPRLRRAITPTPALVFYDGRSIPREMRRARLRDADLLAAARRQGRGSLDDVQAILLEGNGALAVIGASEFGRGEAVAHVAPSINGPEHADG